MKIEMQCVRPESPLAGLAAMALLLAAWSAEAGGVRFGPQRVITTLAGGASDVYAADLDGDGDLDVLSASTQDDTIAWYANIDGKGTFGPRQVITTAANEARAVFAADLDGDGDLDVLSASRLDNKIAWYENADGAGGFGPQRVISTLTNVPVSVFAGDLDGDGDLDVLLSSREDAKIAWHENTDGAGGFGPQRIITTSALSARSAFAADLDGDGDLDVLSASSDDDTIAWYRNTDGAGSFGPQEVISTLANGAQQVIAADLDGDGDMDVLSASAFDNKIAWYKNTLGVGTFGPQRVITTSANDAFSVFAADVDGDGDLDVLSASRLDDEIAWYENVTGAGNFGPQQIITTSADFAISVFAADLDGDGDLDVLSASSGDNKIAWYENLTTPPTPAEGDLSIAFVITKRSTVPLPQSVTYTYHWTSDDGAEVIHADRTEAFDIIDDPSLLRVGQTWTVTVTPASNGLLAPTISGKVKILPPEAGVKQWTIYR